MKKILYIFSIAILALSLVGCKKNKTPEVTQTPEVIPSIEVTPTPTPEPVYVYNAFTGSEKKKLTELFNVEIPFIPNNEYYFEDIEGTIVYTIIGHDGSELEKYNLKLIELGYTYTAWSLEEGHTYEKDNVVIKCLFTDNDHVKTIKISISLKNVDIPTQGGDEPTVDVPTQGGDEPTVDVPTQGGDEPTVDVPTQGGDEPTIDEPEESSIQKVLDAASGLADKGTIDNQTATGTVKSIDYPYNSQYGDITITIRDDVAEIYCYQVKGECASTLKVGDVVTITGQVMNYSGTIEFYKATITLNSSSSNPDEPTVPDVPTEEPDTNDSTIQAILDEASKLSYNATLSGSRTAYGYVKEITEAYTSQYKTISFILSDGTAEILVHRSKSSCASSLKVGDYVTVTGTVINFKNDKVQVIEFQYPEVTLDSGSSNPGDSGNTGDSTSTTHTYNDFTSEEKTKFNEVIGFVIPFIPNDEYSVEEFSDETGTGINFYSFGNTQAEFNDYLIKIENAGFISDGTGTDEYGDTWYYYSKGELYLDVSYYEYEGDKVVDLYIYFSEESDSGNTGGSTGDSGSTSNVDLITNDGKGLPTGTNGVYNVNFNDATYVKNVADQGYYQGGCPTTGDVKVLVIPVEFSDVTASSKGYDLSKLDLAFNGSTGSTDYYSVKEYYNISSYGQLDLDFVILDSWFRPANNSTHYLNATMDYYGSDINIGDQMIMNEALAYLDSSMDLSEFDSDNNGMIDAVIMINTLDINPDVDMQWAYRYWNLYTDSNENYYEYDQVSANDYLWASYKFLLESYEDSSIYSDDNMNTYTYIHEFGHVLGSDDYYDYTGKNEPLSGCDIMDYMLGDHNPYTKFNYGWLTTSRLVVADSTVTLTLEDFSVDGDTIIIADNWDSTLGAYQEYYVLMYYKNTGLNGNDYGYFANDGIVVYHVNASLYKEEQDDEVYYDVYNNNTDASDESGTVDNLIELVKSSNDTFIHGEGVSSISTLPYRFVVDSLTETSASITFTKN